MARVLVTGATGFVGSAVCSALASEGWVVRAAVRTNVSPTSGEVVGVGHIGSTTQWGGALKDVDVVVHLAARVHVMQDSSNDPLTDFRDVNTLGTARLARAAAAAGAQRFVFMSSIKVNGEATEVRPFAESDAARPEDPYAVSKWEAEKMLWEISERTGLQVVVIRPPLIYGPGVKGNLARLLRLVDKGMPLPFANCGNRRSLLSLDNLVGFVGLSLQHPRAAGETFLVCDGEDVSTAEIVRYLAAGMKKKCRLFPVPRGLLGKAMVASGQGALWQRLWGSLQIDSAKARQRLEWSPTQQLPEAMFKLGAAYRQSRWR